MRKVWACSLGGLACAWLAAQPAWQAPPADVRAAADRLKPALRQEMESGDEAKVRSVVAQLRDALGRWAGRTEVETKYHKPVNAGPAPPLPAIREGWDALFAYTESAYKGHGQWLHAGPVPLRETGDVVLGYAEAVKAGAGDRERELQRIREGLDYLLSVQAANGVFPFPDVRGKDPFFGPMLERAAAKNPDIIRNGWMVEDEGDGGLQFDNGVCGSAMLEGYDLLHERKYLDAVRRAADWAAAHQPVANFNYNSFSVWLLARVHRETGERKYLEGAVRKARLGVLPGEMENGRWVDPHNARPAYHWIMVRSLLELRAALSERDPFRQELEKALTAAIDNGAREIVENGAPSFETPLAVLPVACALPEVKPEWQRALNVLINGVFDAAHGDPKAIRGLSPYGYASYLAYRTRQK